VLHQTAKRLGTVCLVLFLSACASIAPIPEGHYSPAAYAQRYNIQKWRLVGRLAISAPRDSWSANIEWDHLPESEKIKLSGPLGQGAIVIELADGTVTIDRGGGNVQTSNQPEQFINQQLGLYVPLQSLRFWAVGLPEPDEDYQGTADGFVQYGWLVAYKELQKIGRETMPHKMAISNDQVKMKLMIDQWELNDGNAN
jgi:outer membrane lipoprotein LolB